MPYEFENSIFLAWKFGWLRPHSKSNYQNNILPHKFVDSNSKTSIVSKWNLLPIPKHSKFCVEIIKSWRQRFFEKFLLWFTRETELAAGRHLVLNAARRQSTRSVNLVCSLPLCGLCHLLSAAFPFGARGERERSAQRGCNQRKETMVLRRRQRRVCLIYTLALFPFQ